MDNYGLKYYPAYAIRHFVDHKDIINKSFDSYIKARRYAERLLIDDDDMGVFTKINGKWYRVWYRKNEVLMVTEEYDGFSKAFPITDVLNDRKLKKKMYDCETCIGKHSCGQSIRECKENHRKWRDEGMSYMFNTMNLTDEKEEQIAHLKSEVKRLKAKCNRLIRENRELKNRSTSDEQYGNDFGDDEATVGPDNWG